MTHTEHPTLARLRALHEAVEKGGDGGMWIPEGTHRNGFRVGPLYVMDMIGKREHAAYNPEDVADYAAAAHNELPGLLRVIDGLRDALVDALMCEDVTLHQVQGYAAGAAPKMVEDTGVDTLISRLMAGTSVTG